MDILLASFGYVLSPWPLFLTVIGVSTGIFVGAIPGLTGTMLIALCLPLTFYMSPEAAIVLLIAIYVGAISGGLITATLLKMPGTEAAVMTTLDGHPMAKNGNPGRALGLGVGASFVGGVVSWFALLLLAQPLSIWATRFSPFDYFALIVMALVLIAVISQGELINGLIAAVIGAILALPGIDPSSGTPRQTFGILELNGGLDPIPMFIGLFAFGTVLSDMLDKTDTSGQIKASTKGILMSFRDWSRHGVNLIRFSVIGTWVGLLPGVGAVIGSMVAYTVAKSVSKEKEKYGHGSEEGIVASEAANNATIGGAMVPLIALGLPGSLNNVLLLAALLIHSIQPGPLLFVNHPDLVYTLIATLLIANVVMYVMMVGSVKWVSQLNRVPRAVLFPIIIVACIVGGFAYNNSVFDVWVLIGFGVLGFLMDRAGYPKEPMAISFILVPLTESKLRTGLQITGGSWSPLYTDPLTVSMLLIAVAMLFLPQLSKLKNKVLTRFKSTHAPDSTEE